MFVESGDIDISSGEAFSLLKRVIPDMKFVKEIGSDNTPAMNVVVKRRNFPNNTLTTDSTVQITSATFSSLRTRARQGYLDLKVMMIIQRLIN